MYGMADCTQNHEDPDVIATSPSKFPLETFFVLHDGILGTFMGEINNTANADHDLCTPIIYSGNGA